MPNQGPWSTSTKVAAANKYITWRFQGGSAFAGKTADIYVAVKNSNGGWGPFVKLTSRARRRLGDRLLPVALHRSVGLRPGHVPR